MNLAVVGTEIVFQNKIFSATMSSYLEVGWLAAGIFQTQVEPRVKTVKFVSIFKLDLLWFNK